MNNKSISAYAAGLWHLCRIWLCVSVMVGCQSANLIQRPVWHNLRIGESSTAGAVEKLGAPATVQQTDRLLIYSYPSTPGGMSAPTKMIFREDVLILVMDRNIEGDKLDTILARYGEPEEVTWPLPVTCITRLFVFARFGIAVDAEVLVSPRNAYVVQKWYFSPMSLEEFHSEFGASFLPDSSTCSDDKYPADYWVR